MADPLVSVIVPTYNRPGLLMRALKSLEAQSFRDFEAIVVNDGGQDVAGVAEQFGFAYYHEHPANRGLAATRNTAIGYARGRYLAYLDDDDWYYPIHLQTLVDGKHRAAYTDADYFYPDNQRRVMAYDYNYPALMSNNLFPCNAVMHERSLIIEVGGFDESLPNHEDWDLWLRIGKVTEFVHIPKLTCAVDCTRQTMSTERDQMMRVFYQVRERYRVPA